MDTKLASLLRRHAPPPHIAVRGRDPQPDPSTGRDRVRDDTQNFRRHFNHHASHATQQPAR